MNPENGYFWTAMELFENLLKMNEFASYWQDLSITSQVCSSDRRSLIHVTNVIFSCKCKTNAQNIRSAIDRDITLDVYTESNLYAIHSV